MSVALLEARGLRKHFPLRGGVLQRTRAWVRAVDEVAFQVRAGETVGIVGESGCGKSTLARLLLRLVEPDAGHVWFDGEDVLRALPSRMKRLRRDMQLVFQDPHASLNPRLTIEDAVAFSLLVHGVRRAEAREKARMLLGRVGLDPRLYGRRYPHELSGGQRQRVNIARALVLDPKLLLLDEPVSSLDKSVQAQVLNLLQELKAERALTYVFISHDLNVIEYVSDRVLVMYLGRVVESGTADALAESPKHPYTQALYASAPSMDPDRRMERPPIAGDPPNPINPPSGCRFRTRCAFAMPKCAEAAPAPVAVAAGHDVACYLYDEVRT
ncbi:MAG: dipeptide/oligopeptide/nickel ABC transporter ATP-binding protein [Candidatus Rokuibacteriota bacterium]|nr:MAG: dipeptide/oligopeptide/nickel ABC transporter ATP-binding protein [Candidatus Rokubacteria bacterium]